MVAEPATVDDLAPGDHACLTFSDADERLDIVATFVRDGLAHGDKVVCLTDSIGPAELDRELTGRGLPVHHTRATGQLEIDSSVSAFLSAGAFDLPAVLDRLGGKVDGALAEGYPGMRITADMMWALRPVAGLEQLLTYEAHFTDLVAGRPATVVCQYDRQGFDAVTLAGITARHHPAVTAVTYHHDPVLRICRQHIPPGVRLAGELDFRALDALRGALSEAARLDNHLFLNMSQLRFIDVAAAGAIVQAALGSDGERRTTVVCRPVVARVLRMLGADRVPGLRLVSRDVG